MCYLSVIKSLLCFDAMKFHKNRLTFHNTGSKPFYLGKKTGTVQVTKVTSNAQRLPNLSQEKDDIALVKNV